MLRIPSCSLFSFNGRQSAFLYFWPALPDLFSYHARSWYQHLLRRCFSLNHHPFDQLRRLSIVGIKNDLNISWFISRLHNFHNLQMLAIFAWYGVSIDVNLILTIIILIININIIPVRSDSWHYLVSYVASKYGLELSRLTSALYNFHNFQMLAIFGIDAFSYVNHYLIRHLNFLFPSTPQPITIIN